MFNIATIRAAETADIELQNANGSPLTGAKNGDPRPSITIHGPASGVWEKADMERARQRMELVNSDVDKNSAEFFDAMRGLDSEFLERITVTLNGFEYPHDGKDGRTPVRALYEDRALGFIRDQIIAASSNWTPFTKGSAKG